MVGGGTVEDWLRIGCGMDDGMDDGMDECWLRDG